MIPPAAPRGYLSVVGELRRLRRGWCRRTFAATAEGVFPEIPEFPECAEGDCRNFRKLYKWGAANVGLCLMSRFCSNCRNWYSIRCLLNDPFPELPERSGGKQSFNLRALTGMRAFNLRYFRKSGGFDPVAIFRSSSVADRLIAGYSFFR